MVLFFKRKDAIVGSKTDCILDLTAAGIVANSEMADVFLYFSNIEDPKTRADILSKMKSASTIF